jgi:hypothetical protein
MGAESEQDICPEREKTSALVSGIVGNGLLRVSCLDLASYQDRDRDRDSSLERMTAVQVVGELGPSKAVIANVFLAAGDFYEHLSRATAFGEVASVPSCQNLCLCPCGTAVGFLSGV